MPAVFVRSLIPRRLMSGEVTPALMMWFPDDRVSASWNWMWFSVDNWSAWALPPVNASWTMMRGVPRNRLTVGE